MPLPDLAEAEPIYVNAKQYRGIMRRRELRAKLEAQNKLAKARKVIPFAILHLQVHMLNFIMHGKILSFTCFSLAWKRGQEHRS